MFPTFPFAVINQETNKRNTPETRDPQASRSENQHPPNLTPDPPAATRPDLHEPGGTTITPPLPSPSPKKKRPKPALTHGPSERSNPTRADPAIEKKKVNTYTAGCDARRESSHLALLLLFGREREREENKRRMYARGLRNVLSPAIYSSGSGAARCGCGMWV